MDFISDMKYGDQVTKKGERFKYNGYHPISNNYYREKVSINVTLNFVKSKTKRGIVELDGKDVVNVYIGPNFEFGSSNNYKYDSNRNVILTTHDILFEDHVISIAGYRIFK